MEAFLDDLSLPIGNLDFTFDPPAAEGVYVIAESSDMQRFLNSDNESTLNGLRVVFVKRNQGGQLYATGSGEKIFCDEFKLFAWARSTDFH